MSAADHSAHQAHADEIDVFGFWIYILTDCVLFATLFATYMVMHKNTFGGPHLGALVSLPYVFVETLLLLFSSFTYGCAMMGVYRQSHRTTIGFLCVTFLLGLGFVGMEINEFIHLVREGHSWQASGAMSAFFTLVGTHGLHVSLGLLWMALTIYQLCCYKLNGTMVRRLTYLGLFWHFLDIVWIFVFTLVYLMGALW